MTELGDALQARPFPAKVAATMGDMRVVINRGSKDGVNVGKRFVIYGVGSEIKDPETGESLGEVELIRGTGKVVHVQDLMATVESDRFEPGERSVVTINPNARIDVFSMFGPRQEVTYSPPRAIPFDDPKVGDTAKPI